MTLHDYLFRDRHIAPLEIAPGLATPRRFTEPRVEHAAVRQAVGLFDFSFMACFDVAGLDAVPFLERVQTRRVRGMRPGQIAYTLLCRPDGTVLNDATVWCRDPARFTLFTGRRSDHAHLLEHARGFDVQLHDVSRARAACAVQGPLALHALQAALPGASWEDLAYFRFRAVDFEGARCEIARVGYTGEAGFEAVTDSAAAAALWQRFASAGAELGLAECGFEAANSLRVEAGFILFACELAQRVTPFELGLGRLLSFDHPFTGSEVLARERWREPARRLVGLRIDDGEAAPAPEVADRMAARGHATLTSACRSPTFHRWIGLGFVAPEDAAPGTRVFVGPSRRATVARLPFYDPMKRRPRTGWTIAAPAYA